MQEKQEEIRRLVKEITRMEVEAEKEQIKTEKKIATIKASSHDKVRVRTNA